MNQKIVALVSLIGVTLASAALKTHQEIVARYKDIIFWLICACFAEFVVILLLLQYIILK